MILHSFSFTKTSKSIRFDRILMNKQIMRCNESESFLITEPLQYSCKQPRLIRHNHLTDLRSEVTFGDKIWRVKQGGSIKTKDSCIGSASTIQISDQKKSNLSQAQAIWDEILNSSCAPSLQLVSQLIDAYGRMGNFHEVDMILHQISSRNFTCLPEVYSLAISCYGNGGQLELMEHTMNEMVSRGFSINSTIGNAVIRYYSIFGSLTQMDAAYGRLKRSRILIDEQGIRAMSLAFLKERKMYRLSEFLRDVGLGRKNVGNLLWNILLLSYAANFKMKSLQREFQRMVEAGFRPDLTTFNIRAIAFSRMSLFWDLHVTLDHMEHEKVVPDLVTYGCFVDAYLDKRLGRNLDFVLNKMNVNDYSLVLTDPLVFEVLGKGDFHMGSEAILESPNRRKWTYSELIANHLKKQYRSNQIFWNY